MKALSILFKMNESLRRLMTLSESFLKESNQRDYSNLTAFDEYRARELAVFHEMDQNLQNLCQSLHLESVSPEEKDSIKSLIQESESLFQTLLLIDQKIQVNLESEKSYIQEDLKRHEKETQTITKFKSTWVPESGERLDGTI